MISKEQPTISCTQDAEFDEFADEYQSLHARWVESPWIRLGGENSEFFTEYKIADTAKLAKKFHLGENIPILDFGSGVGISIPFFHKYFPQATLTCVDVSERSLKAAEQKFPHMAKYQLFDGECLPFPNNSFKLIFTSCVFHHIPANEHVKVLREIHRVLAVDGIFVVFEHNPLNPLTVYLISKCPFDENAVLINSRELTKRFHISGFQSVKTKYRLFIPKILQRLRFLEQFLGWLPLGIQYYLIAQKK